VYFSQTLEDVFLKLSEKLELLVSKKPFKGASIVSKATCDLDRLVPMFCILYLIIIKCSVCPNHSMYLQMKGSVSHYDKRPHAG